MVLSLKAVANLNAWYEHILAHSYFLQGAFNSYGVSDLG